MDSPSFRLNASRRAIGFGVWAETKVESRQGDGRPTVGVDAAARYGGDGFVVVLETIECPQDADFVARRILKGLTASLVFEGKNSTCLPPSASQSGPSTG
jgi:hypothetical protein